MRQRRSDRGSAMVMALWLGMFAVVGAFGLPKVAGLVDNVAGRVDVELAAHLVESSGIPASIPALVAELRQDDPALRLSGTAVAGKPTILPGTAGVWADGTEAVLVLRAGDKCFRAVITASNVSITSEPAGECAA